jgi:hypothetical protein
LPLRFTLSFGRFAIRTAPISIGCRSSRVGWTAYDAKRFGTEMPEEVRMTVTDRAYTSPIWYTPRR